jgi:hypothetical protein
MIPSILKKVGDNGYKVFTEGDYNLNLVGVRTPTNKANSFDDWFYCVFKQYGEWIVLKFPCTTDAGIHWLRHPMKPTGTAILCAGQYRGAYRLDKHRGKYRALCQREGKVSVFRDSNKDEILDKEPESIVDGFFGINIHRATSVGSSERVNKWSAGCQVLKDSYDFAVLIALCDKAEHIYGNTFTYTLLEE